MNRPVDEHMVDAFVERAQRGLGVITREQLDVGWQRLEAPLAGRTSPPHPGWRPRAWLVGFASFAAVAAVVVALVTYLPRTGAPLRYSVEGQADIHGDFIAAPQDALPRLLFSDDSRVELAALTLLTVDSVDERGAHIGLSDGSIDVFVKPRGNTSWTFAAGPFRVKVKGTSFKLGFAAQAGRLTLHMTSGLVEVTAPPNRSFAVAAGESIELFAEAAPTQKPTLPPPTLGEPVVDSTPSAAANAVDTGDTVAAKPVLVVPRTGTVAERRRSGTGGKEAEKAEKTERPAATERPVPWSRLLAQGNFATLVAEAERRGLDITFAQASAADLSSLADAARYTKRYDLAREVLLAMRARFAGSEPARDASFFLGRLSEAAPGKPDAALAWYATYLREAPRGLYASEALGREMTLLAPSARPRAREVARQYLERFPHGSQSELARSILEAGSE
jgi:TolA-binding protein